MPGHVEEIQLKDVPASLVQEAAERIADYAIGFVSLRDSLGGREDGIVGGSGTLVEVDGRCGILTAWHVLEAFPEDGRIGLIVPGRSPRPQLSRWKVDVERLHRIRIAWGGTDVVGPDLGFLCLPSVETSNLTARKSFWNLPLHRAEMLQMPVRARDGIFIVCGYPEEMVEDRPAERGFANVKAFYGFGFAVQLVRPRAIGGYDYIVVGGSTTEAPRSFEGCSGGGLWQVSIRRRKDGELEPDKLWFSGVAFWQSEIIGGDHREIVCHGRRSVYVTALGAIRDWSAAR